MQFALVHVPEHAKTNVLTNMIYFVRICLVEQSRTSSSWADF